jgi:hypothetical protein
MYLYVIQRIAPPLLLALAALAAGCDGDGGAKVTVAPTATVAPSDGASPTAEPSQAPPVETSPTTGEAPAAPVPDVDPSLEVLNLGELNLNIGAGESYSFDPLQLADDEEPPCAAFVFLFGWQVQDPYPPEDVELTITSTRMGSSEMIEGETSGTASVGCGFIDVTNESDYPISVQIRYAIARMTG